MSSFVFGFSHRATAGLFDMPNSYWYNILLILIFSKTPFFISISIFSRKLISISISSRKFMSISIFSRKFISIFSKSVDMSKIDMAYQYNTPTALGLYILSPHWTLNIVVSCAAVALASLCAVSAALSYVLHCHRPDHTSISHHCTLYSGYITSHLGFLDTF